MFGFLKKRLKEAVRKFSSSAKEAVHEETVPHPKPEGKREETRPKKPRGSAPRKGTRAERPVTGTRKRRGPRPAREAEEPRPTPPKETSEKPPKPPAGEPIPPMERDERQGFFTRVRDAIVGRGAPEEPAGEIHGEKIVRTGEHDEGTPTEEKTPGIKEDEGTGDETPATGEEKPGLIGRIRERLTKKTLSEERFEELFFNLELTLLENNVAVEVIEKIKADLKDELTTGKVNRLGLDEMILARLRSSIEDLFGVESFDLLERVKKSEKPFKICMIGVNGSGKTTQLAKLAHLFRKNGLTCAVAASDTFRAAAIDQLREHTDRLGVQLISQGYGADPAAVAYDAIEHAKANNIDVVLIDTAGRLHSNTNLMAELEKVVRVSRPDLKLFVGESITGNDCVEQAKVFDSLVGIDAIILSKADVDEKGGAAISVSYVTGKPILYFGTGQTYDDLEPFRRERVIAAVGL